MPSHRRKTAEPQRGRPSSVETTQHQRQIQTQPQAAGAGARASAKRAQTAAEFKGL